MTIKKQFAILGLGRFGINLAYALEEMGCNVLGVDRDETVAAAYADRLTQVVSFDFRDANTMRQAGLADFDTVVIATKNLESSLMATMLCKEMGVGEIFVKAIDERHAQMAMKLGATDVIFSERDTARRTAFHLISPHAVDHISLDVNISIVGLDTPSSLVGKSIIDSRLRQDYNVNIVAIKHGDETTVTPLPGYVFDKDDRLYLAGTSANIARLEKTIE